MKKFRCFYRLVWRDKPSPLHPPHTSLWHHQQGSSESGRNTSRPEIIPSSFRETLVFGIVVYLALFLVLLVIKKT